MAGNVCIHCNNCGQTNWSKKRGSFLITAVIAWFFLVPAIIYEVWRNTGIGVCPVCGSEAVYPSSGCNIKDKNLQINVIGIVIAVVSIVGAFFLFVYLSLMNYYWAFPTQAMLEKSCFTEGMHYMENHPDKKPSNITMHVDLIDYVSGKCKGTINGKYPES